MNRNSHISSPRSLPLLALALTIALLGGCGGDETINAPPLVSTPPVPTPPPVVVSPVAIPPCSGTQPLPSECSTLEFQVYAATGALSDAESSIWIEPDSGWGQDYSYENRHGGYLRSDSAGYFVTKPVPPATLTVRPSARPDYYFQPCAAIVRSPDATVTRIQLFRRAEFDTDEVQRPSNATEPSLTGTIYEETPEGRKPIGGAFMLVGTKDNGNPYWWFDEPGIAMTLSSRQGQYYFCRLPPDIQFYVTAAGFVDTFVRPGVVAAGVPFNIELKRQGT